MKRLYTLIALLSLVGMLAGCDQGGSAPAAKDTNAPPAAPTAPATNAPATK